MLVEQCSTLRFFQAVKLVDYWCHRADTQAAEDDADRKRQGVHLHASPTFAGTVVINGVLDPVGGAVVVAELARLERQLYLADQHAGIVRTKAQRLAAALVEMAQRSAATLRRRGARSRCSPCCWVMTRSPGCVSWPTAPSSPPAH